MRVLVPVRFGPQTKIRLAGLLSLSQRQELMKRLLAQVLEVLRDFPVTIVGEPSDHPKLDVFDDRGLSMNAALRAALSGRGLPALIVPADLPMISRKAVYELLEFPQDVIVARAGDGGTGALVMHRFVEPSFGPNSALRHAASARARGLRAAVVDWKTFDDLDTPEALSRSRLGVEAISDHM